jgi:hypothetical protein
VETLSRVIAAAGPIVLATLVTVVALAGLVRVGAARSSAGFGHGLAPQPRGPSAASIAAVVVGVALLVAAIVAWASHRY